MATIEPETLAERLTEQIKAKKKLQQNENVKSNQRKWKYVEHSSSAHCNSMTKQASAHRLH